MIHLILSIVFGLVMLLAMALHIVNFQVPLKELRHRARAEDRTSRLLYRTATYELSLHVLLWTVIILSGAACFVMLATILPIGLAIVVVAVLIWVGFVWLPAHEFKRLSRTLAHLSPMIAWVLNYFHSALQRIGQLGRNRSSHTGLYEQQDLDDLLSYQAQQPDNRIPPEVMETIHRAGNFFNEAVAQHMVSRRDVKMVSAQDTIGPLLMDELHGSGHASFPVYESKPDQIVGVLYEKDLLDAKQGGRVSSVMKRDIVYAHENFSLYQALQAIFKTGSQLLIVVNSHGDFVGIITMRDVLTQIIGSPEASQGFDQYEDRQAVASYELIPIPADEPEGEEEPQALPSDTPEVVE